MTEIRRFKITAVRRRLVSCRRPALRAFCPVCERDVETLSAAQAAEVLESTLPQLDQFIADGLAHAILTVSGSLRICQKSLFP